MSYFMYKIKYWEDDTMNEGSESGILRAENCAHAVELIGEDYGMNNIINLQLEVIESLCNTLSLDGLQIALQKLTAPNSQELS